jgi:hypothetical protein
MFELILLIFGGGESSEQILESREAGSREVGIRELGN